MSQLNVDVIKNKVGTGGPTLQALTVTTDATVTGVITASSFSGSLSGTATGLSGTPNITVGVVTATSIVASEAVGIGTTSPGATLDIKAAASTAPLIVQGPSSEFARIDTSGRLLVGTSTSTSGSGGEASVQVAGTSSGGNIHLGLFQFSNSADGGELNLGSSRGTSVGSFTAIQNGDPLGRIRFAGANGSNLSTAGAFITAKADGQTWASGDCPTRLEFSTTADGASSPTERMRLTSTGQMRLASAGITFNGDTATANELDDYEEGTWTPSLGGTETYSGRNGNYVKIGKVVYLDFYLEILSINTGSTTLVTGVPFNCGNPTKASGSTSYQANLATAVVSLAPQFSSSTAIRFDNRTAASDTAAQNAVFKNGTAIYGCITYLAS